jgi:hypothetical protein
MSKWSDEETNEPLIADDRNFYKVEKWTKDGAKVDRMLHAGSSLDKAREIFAAASLASSPTRTPSHASSAPCCWNRTTNGLCSEVAT